MFGDIMVLEKKGIIPRACMHIFDHIAKDTEGTEYTIKCSFLEIYKEIVRDLLNPASNGSKGLRVREAPNKGVWVEGLHESYVTCEKDVLDLLQQGETHRATSSTSMNASSSRSHSLFILTLHQKTRDGSTKEGRLNLADLAGSEKVGKTGATGETLEEAKKINQSLSALGNCINALTKSNAKHIPYRDSKLTHILRESLGGNCKSTLLVACSPHIFNLEETVSTLMFAKRAKTIKNSVKVNKQRSVEELMGIIEKLKKELGFVKKYVCILEQELEKTKGPNWRDDLPKIAQLRQPEPAPQAQQATEESESADTFSDAEDVEEETGKGEGDDSDPSSAEPAPTLVRRRTRTEEERVYSSSADSSLKLAELQVELKKIREQARLDIEDLREEVKSLTQDSDESEKILLQKNELIKERDVEIKRLRDELETQQQAKAIAEEKLRYSITQLTLKGEEQVEAIASMTEHTVELKKKIDTTMQELEDLRSEKEKLQRDHDRMLREREESNTVLMRKAERIENLEARMRDHEQTSELLQQQCTQWESSSKALQGKVDVLEGKHSALLAASRETESKLRSALNAKGLLDVRVQDLTNDLEAAELELKELRTVLEKAQESKEAVQEAGQERIEELLTHSVPLADYDRVTKEKEVFRSKIAELRAQVTQERETVSNLRGELEEASDKHKDERDELLQLLQSEKESHEQQITILEGKLAELTDGRKATTKHMQDEISSLTEQRDAEKASRQMIEQELEALQEGSSKTEKLLRRANASLEDAGHEMKQQAATLQSQNRSLEAQAERIKQLELELDESAKDREILQQEIKTALEINIENAKQFEKQIETIRVDAPRRVPQNIRVPVTQPENRGIIASLFGIKQYPLLSEIVEPIKFGYMLKRSTWLKKWEKRWFVLVSDRIFYFDTNNAATRATGEIELEGTRVVPAGEFTGRPNTLGILHPQREFYLQAANKEEQMDWMAKLATIGKVNVKKVPRGTQSEANLADRRL